jgi:transposase
MVGYGRRNVMVPQPRFDSFDELNADLAKQCRNRLADRVRGEKGTIGERLKVVSSSTPGSASCCLWRL